MSSNNRPAETLCEGGFITPEVAEILARWQDDFQSEPARSYGVARWSPFRGGQSPSDANVSALMNMEANSRKARAEAALEKLPPVAQGDVTSFLDGRWNPNSRSVEIKAAGLRRIRPANCQGSYRQETGGACRGIRGPYRGNGPSHNNCRPKETGSAPRGGDCRSRIPAKPSVFRTSGKAKLA